MTANDPQHPPRARRALLITVLSLAMATGATGTYSLGALSPFLVRDHGLTAGSLGLLLSGLYVVAATSSDVIGRWADRVDPVIVIVCGSTCSLLACFALSASAGIATLVVFAVLAGLAMSASNPGSNGMIARRIRPGDRAYATGIKQSGATGTGLFIAAVMPTIAVLFGWRLAALVAAIIPILAIITVLFERRRSADVPHVAQASTDHAWKSGAWLGWLSGYALLLGVATGICNGFYVLYSHEELGFSEVVAGLIFVVFAVASVFARVFWARLAEIGLSSSRVLAWIGGIGALSAVLCLVAPVAGSWVMWIAALLAGGSIVGWNALGMVTIMHHVPYNAVGKSSGRMLRGFFAGLAVGPLLFGGLVEAGGYAHGWLLQLGVMLLAIAAAVAFGRALARRAAPAPAADGVRT